MTYGDNIGKFLQDFEERWAIFAGPGGFGYEARRRDADGRGRGPGLVASDLDALAELCRAAEAD